MAIEDQEEHGECRKECSDLGRACRKALPDYDDLLSMLVKQKPEAKIVNKVCKKACAKGNAKTIVNRDVDEEFKPRDMKELEMQDMMAKVSFDF